MQKKAIMTFMLAAFVSASMLAHTKVIAHRGYWNCEGSAQNSITALNKAHEIGAYGSELDVSITTDGVMIVNHDDNYQGVCIETSTYNDLKNLKLANGENLPTLDEYLIQGKKNPGTKLIMEIKPHKTVVNEDRAVAAALYLVEKYGMEDQVEYISFSMNVCKELIRRAPAAHVSFLGGNVSPKDLKTLGFAGLDYDHGTFDKHPEWIDEAKKYGLTINVWTVNDAERMKQFIAKGVDYITTDNPVELKNLLNK